MAEVQRRFSAAAWAVHAFSASGAVLALLAVLAIDGQRWTEAML
jgi:phosphatidylserine synthase